MLPFLKAYVQIVVVRKSTYHSTDYPELNGNFTNVGRFNDNWRSVAKLECEASLPSIVAARGAGSHREPVAPLDDPNRKQAIAICPDW